MELANESVVSPNCDARIDRLPVTGWCWKVFLLTGLAIMFGWSNYISGLVLAQLTEIGWADTSAGAVFTASYMGGMFFGSLVGGVVGDSQGRRKSYLMFVGFHAATMYFAAMSPNMGILTAVRFLMGFGLGALLVALYAAFAEYVPSSMRGKWMSRNSFLGNCGGPIASLLVTLIAPLVSPEMNWRLMFIVPALLSTVVWVFALRNIPESPRWLESKGRFQEAELEMSKIEKQVEKESGASLPEFVPSDVKPVANKEIPYLALFRGKLARRVVLGAAVLIAMNVTAYTLMTWLPTILLIKGIDINSSFLLYTVTLLGAPAGAFLAMICMDWVSRKVMGVSLLLFIAIVGPIFATQSNQALLCILGFILQVVVEMYVCFSSGVYVPEIWPTEVRMRGTGLSSSIGRLSGIAMPFFVAILLEELGIGPVFFMMSAISLIAAGLIAVLGIDSRGMSIKQM